MLLCYKNNTKKNLLNYILYVFFVLMLIFYGTSSKAKPLEEITQQDLTAISALKNYLQKAAETDQFSGTVLIAKNNKILFQQAYGLSNRSYDIKNDLHTKFNLASISKLFTSVAIAQLVQEEKISLNDKVVKYLPDWIPNKLAKEMTIRQLLIHTSGLGSFFDDENFKLGSCSRYYINIPDYKKIVKKEKYFFKAGTSQLYSNTGYLFLGAIIEKVTGENYFDYIENHIFNPASMENSGYYETDEVIPNLAVGYEKQMIDGKIKWKNNLFLNVFKGSSAGGSFSSVGDLFNFAYALRANKLLNPKFTNSVLSNEVSQPNVKVEYEKKYWGLYTQYGFAGSWNNYGFAVWNAPPLIGHTGGGLRGVNNFFAMNTEYTIIILSNYTEGTQAVVKKIISLFFPHFKESDVR